MRLLFWIYLAREFDIGTAPFREVTIWRDVDIRKFKCFKIITPPFKKKAEYNSEKIKWTIEMIEQILI